MRKGKKEPWVIDDSYDERMKLLQEQKAKGQEGKRVIKGKEIPWMIDRQAIKRPYADGSRIPGLALDTMRIFVHEIRTHSGRHVHHGGLGLFVLKGKGYTVVDGVKHTGSQETLLCCPLRRVELSISTSI